MNMGWKALDQNCVIGGCLMNGVEHTDFANTC